MEGQLKQMEQIAREDWQTSTTGGKHVSICVCKRVRNRPPITTL